MAFTSIITDYLKYYWTAVSIYSFHSPTLYNIAKAIYSKVDNDFFSDIESLRAELLKDNSKIHFKEYGAGSTTTDASIKTIAQIAKTSLSGRRQCKQLLNLIKHCQPETVIEMGTSLGIATSYMARGNTKSKIITLEGDPSVKKKAEKNFQVLGIENIEIIEGRFEDTLRPTLDRLKKIDMAFIDGNHRLHPTLAYFNTILPYTNESSIIIFDDIYWSSEMKEAWEKIKNHNNVTLTIDLFHMGIVILSRDIKIKQHFNLIELRYKPWCLGIFG